jgi:voltage-gated potassium channel
MTQPFAAIGLDRRWIRQVLFTLVLVGLVCVALGAEWQLAIAALVICAVSFGFFYLVIPGGLHFGITMANFLAVYACMFVFFRDTNFPDAELVPSVAALALPVVVFLLRCFLARRRVAAMIRARRHAELMHLPRLTRWLPTVALVGALSFVLPRFEMKAAGQGTLLVAAMSVIAAAVTYAQRDLVLLMMDVAMVFESVAHRVNRLVMPAMAFLTFYALLVIVFGCLYRIAELTLGGAQFIVHGRVAALTFSDALYFSVVTISTVGYGDIVPNGALVRGLAGLEVVCGLMLLLFGFAEIMRSSGPESEHRRAARADHERPEG